MEEGAWLYKPRSDKGKQSIMQKLGSLKGNAWNKRWVWTTSSSLHYSLDKTPASIKKTEQLVLYNEIVDVKEAARDVMLKQGCPEHLVDFGWALFTKTKNVLWACSCRQERDKWVSFFAQVLQVRAAGFDEHAVEQLEVSRRNLHVPECGVLEDDQSIVFDFDDCDDDFSVLDETTESKFASRERTSTVPGTQSMISPKSSANGGIQPTTKLQRRRSSLTNFSDPASVPESNRQTSTYNEDAMTQRSRKSSIRITRDENGELVHHSITPQQSPQGSPSTNEPPSPEAPQQSPQQNQGQQSQSTAGKERSLSKRSLTAEEKKRLESIRAAHERRRQVLQEEQQQQQQTPGISRQNSIGDMDVTPARSPVAPPGPSFDTSGASPAVSQPLERRQARRSILGYPAHLIDTLKKSSSMGKLSTFQDPERAAPTVPLMTLPIMFRTFQNIVKPERENNLVGVGIGSKEGLSIRCVGDVDDVIMARLVTMVNRLAFLNSPLSGQARHQQSSLPRWPDVVIIETDQRVVHIGEAESCVVVTINNR